MAGSLGKGLREKKLVELVCDIHLDELSLTHLIIDLDGKTFSNNNSPVLRVKCLMVLWN